MRLYKAAEIQKLLNMTKNQVYYRFYRVDKYKPYLTEDDEGIMALNQEGYDILVEEMKGQKETLEEVKEETKTETSKNTSLEDKIKELETYIETLENDMEKKETTIERLLKTIESFSNQDRNLENNQIKNLERERETLIEQLETKDETIQRLLEISKNNQVLLLEKKPNIETGEETSLENKGFFSRLFNK